MKLCLLNILLIDCSPFDSSPLIEVQLLCYDCCFEPCREKLSQIVEYFQTK